MPDPTVIQLYLDFLESILTGALDKDPPLLTFGQDQYDAAIRMRGFDWPKHAFSMIGFARTRNFRVLCERAIHENIAGDILEAGVWRGGPSIMARAVCAAYNDTTRRTFVADSLRGLPAPDPKYPDDETSDFHTFSELAISQTEVRENFAKFNLLHDQVVFVEGWFKDTMPNVPVKQLAILRFDGDCTSLQFRCSTVFTKKS